MSSTISVVLGREVAAAQLWARGKIRWEHTRPIPASGELRDVLAGLLSSPEFKRARDVDLWLDRPPLQKRLLEGLPQVDRKSLSRMVALQAYRLFREHGDLITDAAWLVEKGNPVRKAACVALDTAAADGLVRTVHEAGFRLRRVSVGGAWREHGLDLRTRGLRQRHGRDRWAATLRVAIVAALVWSVGICTLGWRVFQDNRRVTRTLKQLEEPTAAVLAAKRSLDTAAGMVKAIERDERERWRLASQLVWLSSALPDSAFVTSVELAADGAGRASGWAARPLELQPTLERATPPGPVRVTQTAARQLSGQLRWEGFELTMGAKR